MSKQSAVLLVVLLLIGLVSGEGAARGVAAIDTGQARQGLVAVEYDAVPMSPLRLTVENQSREGSRYVYHLRPGVKERFPLQLGNGKYLVTVLEQVEGNMYHPLYRESFTVELAGEQVVYLQPIQNIPWDKAASVVARARELAGGAGSEKEQVRLIYDFLVQNMTYDYEKLDSLSPGYLPDVEETLKTGRGTCYDFSSLFAAMLRSQGIPTKLVMGYARGVNGYHAWNEVYLEGQWQVIDVTSDIQLAAAGLPYSMFKERSAFERDREY